jgi:hypothetical protein
MREVSLNKIVNELQSKLELQETNVSLLKIDMANIEK